MLPSWKIYYLDGSTYAGDAWSAPAFYAILVIQKDPEHGRRIVAYTDYIVYDEQNDRWTGMDLVGMMQYMNLPGRKRVLFGYMIDNQKFNEIYKKAEEDTDFSERTAYAYKEVKVDISGI